MRFADTVVNNIPELITQISKHREQINGPIWYRGHSDCNWKLIPLMFRDQNHDQKTEMNLIKEFKQDATLLTPKTPASSQEWLFIMRHYQVPTRLLDWSESPLVGSYFTISNEKRDDKDGVLWALAPLELNKEGGRHLDDERHLPSFDEDEIMTAYTPESYAGERNSNLLPMAFTAPRNTHRMQSQLSVFTIFHRDTTSIEEIGTKNHIWKYIIPAASKNQIRKELQTLKFGEFQLFPELHIIGKALRGKINVND